MEEMTEKLKTEYNLIQMENCEEALSYIYNNGKYQKLAMILLTICYTCTGAFITNTLIFLEKDPKIQCMKRIPSNDIDSNSNDEVEKYYCLRKEACDTYNTYLISYEFLYEQQSYYSWTNDLRLGCDKDYVIGLFSSIFFIGGFISSLISSSLSDILGRAKLIKISMIFRGLVLFLIILFPSQNIILFSMFFLGLLNSMHSTIPYILLSEYMDKKHRDDYLTYMFIFESFSGILGTFFFLIIQNWLLFLILNLFYGGIFIIFNQYLYESPRYLYSKNLFRETKEVLNNIAIMNLGHPINIIFEAELDQKNDPKEGAISINLEKNHKKEFFTEFYEIFLSEKYRIYIIVMPLIWFLDAFAFFAIYFMIKYFDNNIYLMNIILFFSEAVSYNISTYFSSLFGKRNCMIYSFIISAVSFILFYLFSSSSFITLLLIFSAKFGAAVVLNISSIYTNECFPTSIRGRCTAVCSFLGKFGGILSPMLVEKTKSTSIISSIFCFLAAAILYPLKNSNEKVESEDDNFKKLEKTENKKNEQEEYLKNIYKPDFDRENSSNPNQSQELFKIKKIDDLKLH